MPGLVTVGYWPRTYWVKHYWPLEYLYWQKYNVVAKKILTLELGGGLAIQIYPAV